MKFKIGDIVERIKYKSHEYTVGIVTDVSGRLIRVKLFNNDYKLNSWCNEENFRLLKQTSENSITKEDLEFMYYSGQTDESEGISNFKERLESI